MILGAGGTIEVVGHLFPPPRRPIRALDRFFKAFGVAPVNHVIQYLAFVVYAWGFWRHSPLLIGIGGVIAIGGLGYALYSGRRTAG